MTKELQILIAPYTVLDLVVAWEEMFETRYDLETNTFKPFQQSMNHQNVGEQINKNDVIGGILALRAHCALLLDYVPPEEPLGTPLGNTLRIRRPKLDWRGP